MDAIKKWHGTPSSSPILCVGIAVERTVCPAMGVEYLRVKVNGKVRTFCYDQCRKLKKTETVTAS